MEHQFNNLNIEKRNWVEINDESRGTYTGSDIKFKATMLTPNLCD